MFQVTGLQLFHRKITAFKFDLGQPLQHQVLQTLTFDLCQTAGQIGAASKKFVQNLVDHLLHQQLILRLGQACQLLTGFHSAPEVFKGFMRQAATCQGIQPDRRTLKGLGAKAMVSKGAKGAKSLILEDAGAAAAKAGRQLWGLVIQL